MIAVRTGLDKEINLNFIACISIYLSLNSLVVASLTTDNGIKFQVG